MLAERLETPVDRAPEPARLFGPGIGAVPSLGQGRMVLEPGPGGLEVLTAAEPATGEVGAGAQGGVPARVLGEEDRVARPVDRIADLDPDDRFLRREADVQGLLRGTATAGLELLLRGRPVGPGTPSPLPVAHRPRNPLAQKSGSPGARRDEVS